MRFIMLWYIIFVCGAKVLNFRHYTKQKDLKSICPARGVRASRRPEQNSGRRELMTRA